MTEDTRTAGARAADVALGAFALAVIFALSPLVWWKYRNGVSRLEYPGWGYLPWPWTRMVGTVDLHEEPHE